MEPNHITICNICSVNTVFNQLTRYICHTTDDMYIVICMTDDRQDIWLSLTCYKIHLLPFETVLLLHIIADEVYVVQDCPAINVVNVDIPESWPSHKLYM